MRRLLTILLLTTGIVTAGAQEMPDTDKSMKMPNDHYTGDVYIRPVDRNDLFMTTRIEFAAGAINDWHMHPDAAQTMIVLYGTSLYQEEGQPVQVLKPGEQVTTPANVKHWNGASDDEGTVIISISEVSPKGHIEWFGKVMDRTVSESE